jgi:hypothetical protein
MYASNILSCIYHKRTCGRVRKAGVIDHELDALLQSVCRHWMGYQWLISLFVLKRLTRRVSQSRTVKTTSVSVCHREGRVDRGSGTYILIYRREPILRITTRFIAQLRETEWVKHVRVWVNRRVPVYAQQVD